MEIVERLKILFVEDLPTDMELAIRELRKNGLEFDSKRVETRDAMLLELENFKPDIVISDYAMPQFDGMKALRLLLAFDKNIPIVILTGSTNEDTAVECLRAGASDYVIKEHITRLPYAVREALQQSRNRKDKEIAEQSLREKTEELNNYFTNALDLFCIADINGCFRRLNKAWETTLGFPLSELEGSRLPDLVHPDDVKSAEDVLEDLRAHKKVVGFVNRYRCKDGSFKWIEWRASKVEGMIYGAARNITERIESEKALKESEMFKNDILNSLTGHIAVLDSSGIIVGVNEAWNKFALENNGDPNALGAGADYISVCRKAAENGDLYAKNTLLGIDSVMSKRAANFILEYPCHSQTKKRWFTLRISPMKKSNSGVVVYHENITESKLAEEALKKSHAELEAALKKLNETQKQVLFQEKMRSLGQMTSGICHDINNSLTPIMGYIDLLKADETLNTKYSTSFDRIIKSTNDIAKTISRLREFYRTDLSEKELSEMNINNIILETIELTKHRWKNISDLSGAVINVQTDLSESLPVTIGEGSEIVEALTNLILNACDAMPKGGILEVKSHLKDNTIIIEVKDSGTGMDESLLLRCLDPFFTTKGDKGTGLGLSMVFGIMERHKGELKIDSLLGEGTTVKLLLPVKKPEYKTAPTTTANGSASIGKLKILTVEDDPVIGEMLIMMLEKKGFEPVSAGNGKEGLLKYNDAINNSVPFDIVITDLGMAEMDGISFSRSIKNLTPNIPVILLTGFGSLLDMTEQTTIDYLLNKPILSSELMKAIATLSSKKNMV